MNRFRLRATVRAAAAATLLGLALSPVMASVAIGPAPRQDITLSYDVTGLNFPSGFPTPTIYDILTFNTYPNGSGVFWPSSVDAGGGTINDPFKKSSANPPLTGLLLGLVNDLPNDAPGQSHVVLMMDDNAANQAKGSAWSATFPATLEDQLIADIKYSMEHDRNVLSPADQAKWDTSFGNVNNFAYGNFNKWFAMSASVPGTTTTSSFTVMAWSDGQVIGQGTANLTTAALETVPEPGTCALMLSGLLGIGFIARGRKRD